MNLFIVSHLHTKLYKDNSFTLKEPLVLMYTRQANSAIGKNQISNLQIIKHKWLISQKYLPQKNNDDYFYWFFYFRCVTNYASEH